MHLASFILCLALQLSSGGVVPGNPDDTIDDLQKYYGIDITKYENSTNSMEIEDIIMNPFGDSNLLRAEGDYRCTATDYGAKQYCHCDESQRMSQFKSEHKGGNRGPEDRKWDLKCDYIPSTSESKMFDNVDTYTSAYGNLKSDSSFNVEGGCWKWNNKLWWHPSSNGEHPDPSNIYPTECGYGVKFWNFFIPLCFACPVSEPGPLNGFVVGMESTYKRWYNAGRAKIEADRRYRFFWQKSENRMLINCGWTGWLNEFDDEVIFTLNSNQVISGVQSEYSHHNCDRRWKLNVCKLVPRCNKLKEIKYDMTNAHVIKDETVEASSKVRMDQRNHTVDSTQEITLSKTKSETLASSYTFERQEGHEMSASLDVSVGVSWGFPGGAEGSLDITAGFSETWDTRSTWTRSQSQSITEMNGYTVKFIVTCPADHYCTAQVVAKTGIALIPYEIISYSEFDENETCVEKGTMKVRRTWNIDSVIRSETYKFE